MTDIILRDRYTQNEKSKINYHRIIIDHDNRNNQKAEKKYELTLDSLQVKKCAFSL